MATYFVSRHPGAHDWAAKEGLEVDAVIPHLDPAIIQPGDIVIGTLPVNLAGEVCARGGRYLNLSLDLPPELRGQELSTEQIRACGARIEEYRITRVDADGSRCKLVTPA
ncbi:CRISPR-associated protein Csx16 [Thermochromatium tepidum]|jgi:putative CRISPR-associated protein, VVA1548 family|uniref:CRISPR-associated protein Csx16 n=1 Tax=Thermochromatium tepidum ATCC 43061 TaxID=316276 RepID=A0A6I6DX46_THETI|nr:CRISPR-associated protein Csx16 [Thermochromatium tepidum]QGU32114.1 CRISPR-associated protein Csx16 [Thermochromatium tepidum ATCC 43061]